MFSDASWKHVAGALAVLLAAAAAYAFGRTETLRHERAQTWSYARVPHTAPTPLERRLGDTASLIARRLVQVRCVDLSDGTAFEPGGIVEFNAGRPADYARIRPDECTALVRFMRAPAGAAACAASHSCGSRVLESADALNVLAHEAVHLSGSRNEAVTECRALHEIPRVAHDLGASLPDGRALAILEYTFAYSRLPPEYRLPGCAL